MGITYTAGTSQSATTTAIGQVADWSNIITNIDPETTILFNRYKNGEKATDMETNWQLENLQPPGDNAHAEKVDYTSEATPPRSRMSNYVQHLYNSFYVTDAQENRKLYGVPSEVGRQRRNAAKKHSADIEYAMLKNGIGNIESGATVARMTGVRGFVKREGKSFTVASKTLTVAGHGYQTGDIVHFYIGSGGTMATGVKADTRYFVGVLTADTFKIYSNIDKAIKQASSTEVNITAAGTTCYVTKDNIVDLGDAALSETSFNMAMQKQYDRGGVSHFVIASPGRKADMSQWTAGQLSTRDGNSEKLKRVVSWYTSDFGEVELVPHRLQDDDRIDIQELQYWEKAPYIATKSFPIAKKGSYVEHVIETYMTMRCRAPLANAALINVG